VSDTFIIVQVKGQKHSSKYFSWGSAPGLSYSHLQSVSNAYKRCSLNLSIETLSKALLVFQKVIVLS